MGCLLFTGMFLDHSFFFQQGRILFHFCFIRPALIPVQRRRYRADNRHPCLQSVFSWEPRSMIRPWSRTMITSELRMVESRWAITKEVRPSSGHPCPPAQCVRFWCRWRRWLHPAPCRADWRPRRGQCSEAAAGPGSGPRLRSSERCGSRGADWK